MAGRIITMQRQMRELGRLRTGTFNGRYPERSETWILSSHAEHYVRAAAERWGGTAEEWQPQGGVARQWRVITTASAIDAVLPPGDPLSQSYEMWNRGGCTRRCDGVSEDMSCGPCLCRAEFGDAFHEKPREQRCQSTTRLNVILPDLPDFGVWRAETKSFYAANEIAGAIDLIRAATGGQSAIPVRLRIEQRHEVSDGKRTPYQVIVVEIRGATAGQILAGMAPVVALESGQPARAALPAAAQDNSEYRALADGATTVDEVKAIWAQARDAGALDEPLKAYLIERGKALMPVAEPAAASGESEDDLWQQIVAGAPDGWTTTDIDQDFEQVTGVSPGAAKASDMTAYLDQRKGAA